MLTSPILDLLVVKALPGQGQAQAPGVHQVPLRQLALRPAPPGHGVLPQVRDPLLP